MEKNWKKTENWSKKKKLHVHAEFLPSIGSDVGVKSLGRLEYPDHHRPLEKPKLSACALVGMMDLLPLHWQLYRLKAHQTSFIQKLNYNWLLSSYDFDGYEDPLDIKSLNECLNHLLIDDRSILLLLSISLSTWDQHGFDKTTEAVCVCVQERDLQLEWHAKKRVSARSYKSNLTCLSCSIIIKIFVFNYLYAHSIYYIWICI